MPMEAAQSSPSVARGQERTCPAALPSTPITETVGRVAIVTLRGERRERQRERRQNGRASGLRCSRPLYTRTRKAVLALEFTHQPEKRSNDGAAFPYKHPGRAKAVSTLSAA